MNVLEKYSLDFVGPKNVFGVAVTTNGIRYRLTDLTYVQYLNLADSKVLSREIRRDVEDFEFDMEFYPNHVNSELDERQSIINEHLFLTYQAKNKRLIKDLKFSVVIKYLKVFNMLRMYNRDIISRDTCIALLERLSSSQTVDHLLIEAILKSVFLNNSTMNYLISQPSYSYLIDFFLKEISDSGANLPGLLADTFRNHGFCPILGCVFLKRKDTLRSLLSLGIKKREFFYVIMPYHDLLMNFPAYAAFTPISDYGKVCLEKGKFQTRDHLLFEIIAVLWLRIANLSDTDTMIYCMQLIYKTVPYPYITVPEIYSRLKILAPQLSDGDIRMTVNAYKCRFPKVTEKCCPRSLADLCRCTARNAFNGTYSIEKAGEKLNIPLKFIKFLNLEDEDVPFCPSDRLPERLPCL